MRQGFVAGVWALVLSLLIFSSAPAGAVGLDPAFNQELLGPERAMGVVVWNHGRSLNVEASESLTPLHLWIPRNSGGDVLRFNRSRDGDTLTASARRLVEQVGQLKHKS